jgi:hypothetical protein
MKRPVSILVVAVTALALSPQPAAFAEGATARNELVLYPSIGVTLADNSFRAASAGLGIGYSRFVLDWIGVGLKPTLTVVGLGTSTVRPLIELECFVEFRPFSKLRGLHIDAYVKSLGVTLSDGSATTVGQFVGGGRAGYLLPLFAPFSLSLGLGAEVSVTAGRVGLQPSASVGLAVSF